MSFSKRNPIPVTKKQSITLVLSYSYRIALEDILNILKKKSQLKKLVMKG